MPPIAPSVARQRRLALAERDHVHRHVAERDACRATSRARSSVARRRTRPCRPAEARSAQLPRRIVSCRSSRRSFAEDLACSAARRSGAEAEELDLLRVVVAREHVLEVQLHARVSGERQCEQPERLAREAHLGDERRESPRATARTTAHRRERGEQRDVADERDGVLHEPKAADDERQRPRRGLAPRARQLVVELRVLEVRELERQRLLEDHHVDALPELRAQQRLAEARCRAARRRAPRRARPRGRPGAHARVGPPPRLAASAATTASTISLPTYATPAGSAPATSVSNASAIVSARWSSPDERERASAVAEHAEVAAGQVGCRRGQRAP